MIYDGALDAIDKPISALGLHRRIENSLFDDGVKIVAHLVVMTEKEFCLLPRCGQKALKEVREVLAQNGLHLGMDRDEIIFFLARSASIERECDFLIGLA